MNVQIDKRIDGWIDGWKDGSIDEWKFYWTGKLPLGNEPKRP